MTSFPKSVSPAKQITLVLSVSSVMNFLYVCFLGCAHGQTTASISHTHSGIAMAAQPLHKLRFENQGV